MLAVLIIGYFQILSIVGILLILLSVMYLRFRRQGERLSNSKKVLKNLKKTKFSQIQQDITSRGSEVTEDDRTCIICWL